MLILQDLHYLLRKGQIKGIDLPLRLNPEVDLRRVCAPLGASIFFQIQGGTYMSVNMLLVPSKHQTLQIFVTFFYTLVQHITQKSSCC